MKNLKIFLILVLAAASVIAARPMHANAASFNGNRVIDDAVFDDKNSMNASQIDTFLNSFSSSCISTNNGFQAIDPTGYNPTSGYQYGGFVSAGQVIYDASQTFGINPKVLLTTLEKEQSLVTGRNNFAGYCDNGDQHKYAAAVGYGCPDSGTTYNYSGVSLYQRNGTAITSTGTTCVNSANKAGFSQQVIRAAWLLKFGEQRSEGNIGWSVIMGNWDNSDDPQSCYGGPMVQGTLQRCPSGGSAYYDGYITIDGTSTHMDSGSTAALYWYTPHFSGNQSFFNIFSGWFGSTYTDAYRSQFYAQSTFTEPFYPGESRQVFLQYKNAGSAAWYDDTSVPTGMSPVHLAASVPTNRSSVFSYGWPSGGRPNFSFTKVYEADGITLASNQHIVMPGQIGRFDFNITPPWNVDLGVHREYFQPVLEGAQNWNLGGVVPYLDIDVESRYNASFHGQTSVTNVQQNVDIVTNYFQYKNAGSAAWYDDTSVPTGYNATHLATTAPLNRTSTFAFNWPSKFRAADVFTKVYEADGITLASNQHIVMPGQIGQFSFQMIAPLALAAGDHREYFQPVLEGSYHPTMGAVSWLDMHVISSTYTAHFSNQSSFPSVQRGQSYSSFLQYKNAGSAAWYDDTSVPTGMSPVHLAASVPTNRSSVFSYGWPSGGRPNFSFTKVYEADGITLASNQHIVMPGQIGRFDFNITPPWNVDLGVHREYFQPVLEGAQNWNLGAVSWLDVSVHN